MRPFLIILALLFSLNALATGTSANLSWTAPISYTDGSPLPASDIASYTVTWTGKGTINGSITVTGTATTINIPCDQASFMVSVTTTATALYPNAVSDPAGPVSYATSLTCKPSSPTGLKVQ